MHEQPSPSNIFLNIKEVGMNKTCYSTAEKYNLIVQLLQCVYFPCGQVTFTTAL